MDNLPLGPGKTAPRLILDLLDYDPKKSFGKNLLADPAPQYKKGLWDARHPQACRHSLMRKESTRAPASNDEQPGADSTYEVAAYCNKCRHHFKISVDYTQHKAFQKSCRQSDNENLLHHFRRKVSTTGKDYRTQYGANMYDHLVECHDFGCTGTSCPASLSIKISAPRLGKSFVDMLTDKTRLDIRGRKEIAKDPSRYQGVEPASPATALLYLRSYLTDAKSAKGTKPRNIAKRNKKFVIAFGDDCNDLFEALGFAMIEEPAELPDEGMNGFWKLPIVTDENQGYINDVIFEIDVLYQNLPQTEQNHPGFEKVYIRPVPALKDIERSLGCFDYPMISRTIDIDSQEHPYYKSLGAVETFTDDYLSWAYDRQCSSDPANKPYYFDCLEDLANGRKSSDLQMKVTIAVSLGEYGLKQLEDSFKFFGLDADTKEGDDHIMGLFKSRVASAPRQKEEAKACLMIIAKHRSSEAIEALAKDDTMSFEEALEFLNVASNTASDSVEAAAIAMALDGDRARVARALQVIANHRPEDFDIQRAAAQMELGNGASYLTVSDAYTRLQIAGTGPNLPDETVLTYYQSLSSGAPSGSKDSFAEALRTIALERKSLYLLRKLHNPDAVVHASTADPVGLDNIGNTCYLNSLLQYYYTIKPVRELVIDFPNHRMELNEQNLKVKRVGGRIVDKSEIIKAQKFVEELGGLFENLKTASTRSVKPTKQLAELTLFSSEKQGEFLERRKSISTPSGPANIDAIMGAPVLGPQLPPPPLTPPSSRKTIEDDIEMIDDLTDRVEARDDSSEATLVDMDQAPNGGDKDSIAASKVDANDVVPDAVMVNGEYDPDGVSKPLSPPEKPPPVPPRNKSGLVISTTEHRKKDLAADDDFWTFGTQQDVTEVIGNVTYRLQCAIKPTSIEEESGEQVDIIRDTFFGANTTYTEKEHSTDTKVEAWPTIICFPGKDGEVRDLYGAIDVIYDAQPVEVEGKRCPQYFSISKLPQILQIQIQRTDFDPVRQSSIKNRTPVAFPETLYLDRYVASEDPDSAVMRRRRETWKWKSQLRLLEARQKVLENSKEEINVPDALLAVKDHFTALQEEEIEGIEIPSDLPEALEERISQVSSELDQTSKRIDEIKKSLKEQFTDMRDYGYKLHSVFIHRGEAGGGHYWVYIYDFEHDIWREYNDEHVSEVKDRRRIFDQTGTADGTPYYLVYVQAHRLKELVDVVCREVQDIPVELGNWSGQMDGVVNQNGNENDTEIEDEDVDLRHVEYANPRPIRPKPGSSEHQPVDGHGNPW
ncbi:related to UBP2 Ubiquitin-specific proteinase [Rhynchosporium agropyri]|uniref:ubiquitinyl hydrolase 1 n=1 Tax=Rhynchosporium agropyri TaxID=914238 RepID=A0A1E1KAL6_9HELO|nr:related to UBP2 Ubiquitin-specific proteinase [Rhynchosporium agropyri]